MSNTWNVVIDTTACSGMGDCLRAAPGMFELQADGTARTLLATTSDERVLDAAFACPMAAIAVYNAETGEQAA
jgi:ferredoxin